MACNGYFVKFSDGLPSSLFRCMKCQWCRDMTRWEKISSIDMEARAHFYGRNSPVGAYLMLTYRPENLPTVERDTRVWSDCVVNRRAIRRAVNGRVETVGYDEGVSGREVVSGSLGPERVPTLVRSDFQGFMKRLRVLCFPSDELKKRSAAERRERLGILAESVRFAMVGEYGGKHMRPHFHVLLFGFPSCRRYERDVPLSLTCQCEVCVFYKSCWRHGYATAGSYFVGSSGSYLSKYTTKLLSEGDHPKLEGRVPEFYQTSTEWGDGVVVEEARLLLQREASGEVIEDFPREIFRGDTKYRLSQRQLKVGRLAMGRSVDAPASGKLRQEKLMEPLVMAALAEPKAYLRPTAVRALLATYRMIELGSQSAKRLAAKSDRERKRKRSE